MALLIDSLTLPKDLHTLSDDELTQVCGELRDELIATVSESGGHFASSLGATEISVILHALFNTPNDKVIWDVGHQGYIHKMLTGRRDKMGSIRKKDGLSGFLRRDESPYDTFGAGHAGTSISAGVGIKLALQKNGSDQYVIPVIGDGSLTSGMVFEALNHAGSAELKNFIVILNDNEMSISPNVGALSWLFSRAITGESSTAIRKQVKEWHNQGYIPDIVYNTLDTAESAAQSYFSDASLLFESFGFRYIGIVDGHNIPELRKAIENAKRQDGPVLIHARTKKGKGFQAAEKDPLKWHGVKPFDRTKAEFYKSPTPAISPPPTYTTVFSNTVVDLARKNKKIIGITAAMPTGTGLDQLQRELPDQFIDVGICEQHAVTFAAGLATEGYIPVCTIYSTFLQRAYDQIIHDVCIQKLPVIFAIDRAGAVGNDGETHQGLFDISYLRTIPDITILCPKDQNELRNMLYTAVNIYQKDSTQSYGPIAIRYPRGNAIRGISLQKEYQHLPLPSTEILQHGSEMLMITTGPTGYAALEAAKRFKEEYHLSPTVLHVGCIKPLDTEIIAKVISEHNIICTVEDHTVVGGFGSAILELCAKEDLFKENKHFNILGASDSFTPHGTQEEQYKLHGYDAESLFLKMRQLFGTKNISTTGTSRLIA